MRAFSLFTPLVGTAIVIMTIIVAVTVVQNDVRISRSLSASYSITSQTNVAKLIKAAAQIHVLENLEKSLGEFLKQSSGHIVGCSTANECKTKLDSYFVGPSNSFTTQRTLTDLFDGVDDEVRTVTDGYSDTQFSAKLSNAITAIVNSRQAAFTTSYDGSKLSVATNAQVLAAHEQEGFVMDFVSSDGRNSVQVSIAPSSSLSVSSADNIKDFVEATKAFTALVSTSNFKTDFTTLAAAARFKPKFKAARAFYNSASKKVRVEVEWNLASGTFKVGFQQSGFAYPLTSACYYNGATGTVSAVPGLVPVVPC